MSYKLQISTSRAQFEPQQEKLRIARQALARVEAKYARERQVKHRMQPAAKMGARRTRAQR